MRRKGIELETAGTGENHHTIPQLYHVIMDPRIRQGSLFSVVGVRYQTSAKAMVYSSTSPSWETVPDHDPTSASVTSCIGHTPQQSTVRGQHSSPDGGATTAAAPPAALPRMLKRLGPAIVWSGCAHEGG